MVRPRRHAASLLVAAAIGLVGCGDGPVEDGPTELFPSTDEPTTTASAPVTPSPTATAASQPTGTTEDDRHDVTTVPAEVTPGYVEAVYAEIISTFAPLLRAVLEAEPSVDPSVPDDAVATLSGIVTGDARLSLLELLSTTSTSADRAGYVGRYEGPRMTDTTVLYAGGPCLIAAGRLDFSDSGVDRPPPEELLLFSFVPAPDGAPAAWLLSKQLPNASADGPNPDSVALEGDLSVFGDLLEHECTEADDVRR